jgi:hypothetical protein
LATLASPERSLKSATSFAFRKNLPAAEKIRSAAGRPRAGEIVGNPVLADELLRQSDDIAQATTNAAAEAPRLPDNAQDQAAWTFAVRLRPDRRRQRAEIFAAPVGRRRPVGGSDCPPIDDKPPVSALEATPGICRLLDDNRRFWRGRECRSKFICDVWRSARDQRSQMNLLLPGEALSLAGRAGRWAWALSNKAGGKIAGGARCPYRALDPTGPADPPYR